MELLAFGTELLDALGGVVEREGEDAFRVLLEPDLAARVGLPGEARLVAPAAPEGDGIPLCHGSDLVQRLVAEALGSGRVASLFVDVGPPRVKSVEAAVGEAFRPANGVVRVGDVLPGTEDYLVVGFRYCATGDEKREGMVDVAVTADGTAAPVGLAEILWANEHLLRDAHPGGAAPLAPAAWRAATVLARRRVVETLAPVREIVSHRLERDVSRLHGYYRAMQAELLRSAARRAVAPADAEKILLRANGIPGEFQRRVTEARVRLALHVSVRPMIAVRVSVPAVSVRIRVLRRKQERELLLRFDGLRRAFDVPLCEACGAVPVSAPVLCDDRVHLLCAHCWWECPSCGAHTCLACRPRCGKCGARPGDAVVKARAPATCAPRAVPPPPARSMPSTPSLPRVTSTVLAGAGPSRPPGPRSPAAARPPSPPDADRRGARALARMAEALGESFDCAAPEERIRQALRSLGSAGTTLLAHQTGLPSDVVRRTLAELRARGEVVHVGHGRGTEYRLA
ncbi:MAG: hypothetical protein HY905_06800 [Deltaproteobacteria bacterium]|nr:hypothetical protein [Deltaproteobacteria bacterium]